MPQALRLAAAQLDVWVGDVEGNTQKIVNAAYDARDRLKADLVLTPELGLLGYPPDDLLLRSGLPAKIEAGLNRIRKAVGGIHVVVGHPEYTPDGVYNAASVYRDGELVARARKQILPNYGVFDEKRHFKPGRHTTVFTLKDTPVALCICEDVWGPNPAAQAKAAGAQLLLNLNASPFTVRKSAEREGVFHARIAETGLPLFYVNMTGGQDDLLFDGDSAGVNADGSFGFRAPRFEEGVYGVEFENGTFKGALRAADSDEAVVYKGLVQSIRDYVNRNGFPGAIVGMSGGVDSALVAALAVDALGKEKVWGVAMPSRYTADMSNQDAEEEARALGIRFSTLPIEPAFQSFLSMLAPEFGDRPVDLAEENLQSRTRGVLLMALSNKFGHVVLTTGNKSEMAVGYATLYGDMCGGFAPIKDVYKTLVYKLARHRNAIAPVIPERVLTRAPSAELRPDQTDQDSLPPYEELDAILQLYVEEQRSIPEIIALGHPKETVTRVAALVRRSEYKRRQAPPGPKITPRAFGRDRRYPITAVYGDI